MTPFSEWTRRCCRSISRTGSPRCRTISSSSNHPFMGSDSSAAVFPLKYSLRWTRSYAGRGSSPKTTIRKPPNAFNLSQNRCPTIPFPITTAVVFISLLYTCNDIAQLYDLFSLNLLVTLYNNNYNMNPVPPAAELILIGAGPGDPDLLTVKAWRTLQKADFVLYDRLVHPAVLDLAPAGCERICVGKLPNGPSTSQDTIHRLIREKAEKGGVIVRLKGGDPFIFGRGFEEAMVAHSLGLRVTYIPGITSMQTAGLAEIPLTHRSVSEGIWILTGTRKDGSLSADLRLAIRSKSTVVIYMGMKKLAEIADRYKQEGKGETPAAIIRNGSLTHQKLALG